MRTRHAPYVYGLSYVEMFNCEIFNCLYTMYNDLCIRNWSRIIEMGASSEGNPPVDLFIIWRSNPRPTILMGLLWASRDRLGTQIMYRLGMGLGLDWRTAILKVLKLSLWRGEEVYDSPVAGFFYVIYFTL